MAGILTMQLALFLSKVAIFLYPVENFAISFHAVVFVFTYRHEENTSLWLSEFSLSNFLSSVSLSSSFSADLICQNLPVYCSPLAFPYS